MDDRLIDILREVVLRGEDNKAVALELLEGEINSQHKKEIVEIKAECSRAIEIERSYCRGYASTTNTTDAETVVQAFRALGDERYRILCIKIIRPSVGGLKETKDFVDSHWERNMNFRQVLPHPVS